ncbi:hypothetical protein Psyc_0880 [Psychrobacter arcticus 273-4]|uniref:Uncharacterized protein n=1 Tax=Psychrobacter arcticus (strain DSM 17307 / VKM B-2377 / 273-4) TaxID=259536 RepID=Q4FTC5_PSYA2|nr:hypothetical protein [Psychrobacter arcticus]AAZ18733.1 hypothetical protein Psyc_0880 [Psychrobacter arcticus 273-4]
MKKILLSMALSLTVLSANPVMAAAPAFSASQMAQVKIKELSFKEVMRQFYSGEMVSFFIDDETIEAVPHVGLGQANSDDERTVALMNPIIDYTNNAGESRYLVIIEKVQVDSNTGSLVSCHVCKATADIYSFKKLNNGQFQLVSRTPKNVEPSGINGRVMLDEKDIKNTMQPLGKEITGSVLKNGSFYHGIFVQWWDVLHLPENDFINLYGLGDAGMENGVHDEDSPLYYGYEGTLKVLSDNTTYYPIMLSYKGEKPTEDYEHIEHVNYSKIMKFNSTKKAYE